MMKASLGGLLVFLFLLTEAQAALIHGNVFEWSTLSPLNNVLVDVNSTPPQRMVSKDGAYSFELPPGDYKLVAEFYENRELKYLAQERLRIEGEGRFVYDLILVPPLGADENDLQFPELDLPLPGGEPPATPPPLQAPMGLGSGNAYLFLAVLVLIALSLAVEHAAVFSFLREQKEKFLSLREQKTKLIEEDLEKPAQAAPPAQADEGLDKYAQEVLDVLARSGNRLTQKEIRERLQHVSEAKVSLIVSELEALGRVKKIKHGRGNIVVLKEGP